LIDNICIFQKVKHDTSGEEIESAYLNQGTYIESLELDGPKLILEYRDPEERIKNILQVKEYDEFTVSFGDPWRAEGVSEQEKFIVLTCKPAGSGIVRINLMAKPVFEMKKMADKTRIFAQRGIPEILKAFASGMKLTLGKFPVVENYHCIAGERPSALLRQIASEQGAHIWYARGTLHMKRFAEMFAQSPAVTFHWGTFKHENSIFRYTKPSSQMKAQESAVRTFTGWNEVTGRVKTALDMPVLFKAGSKPTAITSSPSTFVLGNAPIAKKTAIDFVAMGSMAVTPGQVLSLVWHMPDPANPINEGLPAKVVVESVAHWYSSQKYYSRVKGAVALEPF